MLDPIAKDDECPLFFPSNYGLVNVAKDDDVGLTAEKSTCFTLVDLHQMVSVDRDYGAAGDKPGNQDAEVRMEQSEQ